MNKPDDYEKTELCLYQCFMGKLMYFACNTKPDIAFTVEQLRKQNFDLRKDHLQTVKRVV